MKKMNRTVAVVLCMVGVAFGQGSLTPPGAPSATMKTLDELDAAIGGVSNAVSQIQDEVRTPISVAGYTINSAGSYYLTADLVSGGGTFGINIDADDVTLDLNGFSIRSASGQGIFMNDRDNVVVKNGTIRECYYYGIAAFYTTRCRFENLRVLGNGRGSTAYDGIRAGTNITITGCTVMGNGSGIEVDAESKITGNQIVNNTNDGLHLNAGGSYVADNMVKGNGDNYDLAAGNQLNLLICEIPEILNWPCSVKLAGTLTLTQTGANGITVYANDITIDMDGHTLIGPGASSGSGIYQYSNYRNLTVKNGKVTGWQGSGKGGIYVAGKSSIMSGLQASANYYGIYAYTGSTISGCAVYNNADIGILAGLGSTISGCSVYDNADDGIYANSGSTISGCSACGNGNDGIYANSGSTISGCTAYYNLGDGIQVSHNSRVADCTCNTNGHGTGDGAGIHATGQDNRIDGNNVTDNDRGIDVDLSDNLIVRNSASGNATNYDIAAGNDTGTIQTTPVGAGAWDNFEF